MVTSKPILPYFHPTTLVCVDDDESFLSSLRLTLKINCRYEFFSSTTKAINYIDNASFDTSLDSRFLSLYQDNSSEQFSFDLDIVEREISNGERYNEISVIVVDYDMGHINGLEFCEQIKNKDVKKILLTGVASDKIAVDAFNRGIIDKFIFKNDPNIIETINDTITELQYQHFNQSTKIIQQAINVLTDNLLSDTNFTYFFGEFLKKYAIIEYYFVDNLTGFILTSKSGAIYRLVIQKEDQLANANSFAGHHRIPAEFKSKMIWEHTSFIVNLWESPEDYYDQSEFDWSDKLIPATRIPGVEGYYYGLIETPPIDIDYVIKDRGFLPH